MQTPTTFDRKTVWSWALYDFANSAFTTLVVTFIYSAYFTKAIAPSENVGTAQWSTAVAITGIVVALASPFVGAIADRGGYRKRLLASATFITIAGSVALFFPGPGEVWRALVTFTIANISFELGNVFYNAYLPDIAPHEKIGRISGYGWALGYAGGLVCLVIALFGFVQTEQPLFGLSTETGENVRATNVLVAAWFAVFCLPLLLFVRDRKPEPIDQLKQVLKGAVAQIAHTFDDIRTYRDMFRMLLARLIYNDGLVTIFAFGGIYAVGTFGFTFEEVIIFGIALNVAAGIGAFLFGFLDDKIGGKYTILITLAGLTAATCIAVFAQTKLWFWVAGILVGILAGPNQSASRSLMGRFVPDDKENEFYGFFAFSGKATAFLGPLLLGQLTLIFDSQRYGVAIVAVFFIVGALVLLLVNEQEGIRASGRPQLGS